MKNNKKEESDKEETEDTKTDVWWIAVEIRLWGFSQWGRMEPLLKTDDWIPSVLYLSPVRTQFVFVKTDLITAFMCLRKAALVFVLVLYIVVFR